jgi:cytidylate kinase
MNDNLSSKNYQFVLPSSIAIDGPAASGKSTLGKRIADRLGYLYFDTGVMYRAITWVALHKQVDIEDENKVTGLAQTTVLDIQSPSQDDGRQCDILADGVDITWEIRAPEVDRNVSLVSSYAGVREALTLQQRKIGQRGHVVMMGRDIGTVVLPDADLKIYLDASTEVRAQRRHSEILNRGEDSDQEQVLNGMYKRDKFDSTRKIAPLKPAEDAEIICSDDLDENQVLERVLLLISQSSNQKE